MMKLAKRCFVVCCVTISVALPMRAHAQVSSVAFTSDPQAISANTISAALTVQARTAAGDATPISQTACLALSSSSATGRFSSSASTWNAITVLTMSKNTTNKNFYYQDSSEGSHTITVRLAFKPESESRACSAWPLSEWGTTLDASQVMTIGVQAQSNTQNTSSAAQASTTTQTQSQTTQTTPQTVTPPVSSYVPPPLQTLFADAGADRVEIVGADTVFRGRAYTRAQTLVENVRYVWNFGDGTTAEGESVQHHYNFPGRYAVTLTVAQDRNSGADRLIVTAEPARLGFVVHDDGSVEIVNNAGRDLDLSHWIVAKGYQRFMLPDESYLLAGASLRISQKTLAFMPDTVTELQYPNGVRAFGAGEATSVPQFAAVPVIQETVDDAPIPEAPVAVRTPPQSRVMNFSAPETSDIPPADVELATSSRVSSSAQVAAAGSVFPAQSPWFWGVFAIVGVGALAGMSLRSSRHEEWEIEEGENPV